MGGHWDKTERGWQWNAGATFPTPGGDAVSVTLPRDQEAPSTATKAAQPSPGPVVIDGKLIPRLVATFEHRGRKISICAETKGDIRAVWDELGLPPLDLNRVQSVVIASANSVKGG